MKKLEKLKLHNLEEIGVEEQRSLRGGGDDDIIRGTLIGEVECLDKLPEIFKERYYAYDASAGGSCSGFSYYNGSDYDSNHVYGSDPNWGIYNGYSGSDVLKIDDSEGGGGSLYGDFNNHCTMSKDGIEFMKSWEKGLDGGVTPALMPYDDNGKLPGGNMTIGWGHKIKPGENYNAGITLDQANALFLADLQISINDVNNSVHVSLTQTQFDALVSYSFNIGGLGNSPECLRKLNNGDYAGAAAEMDIVTEDGKTLTGLVTRRDDEQTIFNDGIYYCHY